MTRTVLRFVRWAIRALTTDDGHPPIYSAICAKCHEASIGYTTTEHAENWAMSHASQRRAKGQEDHLVYRMVIESYAVVRQVTSAP